VIEGTVARRFVVLGLAAVLGYMLWVSWVYFLERGLPLDGGAPYLGILFVAGAILAAVEPEDPWPGPVGLYLGQAMALAGQTLLGLGGDPHLVPLRLFYLLSITLSAVLGAASYSGARSWIEDAVRPR